ncbi:MAG: hypothetical protein HC800_22935, partial [Phormidesmis sp. RL_2_1]|nr:hypothetical protein [Phormidesmis sp. RL_2_1]
MSVILVTGPARSGKSEWAEYLAVQLASQNDQQVPRQIVYIATAQANSDDVEWQVRLEKHRLRRPEHWYCQEVPVALAGAIASYNQTHCVLVDSLGTWLANLIEQADESWNSYQQTLIATLSQTDADVILVAEETGWGIVPAYESGANFRLITSANPPAEPADRW